MKRTERLHAMAELLRRSGTRGRTTGQLAAELGVSTRTVKRDLVALEAAGLPVWGRPGPGGGYGLAGGASLPPITLTPAQSVALSVAVAAAGDAPFADLARAGLAKILDVLDPHTREQATVLGARVWVNDRPGASRRAGSALEAALRDQVTVRISYTDAAGNATRREVEPIIFAATGDRWYLVGWCRLREAVRWFDLTRIDRAVATRTPCTGHGVDEIGTPPEAAAPVMPST